MPAPGKLWGFALKGMLSIQMLIIIGAPFPYILPPDYGLYYRYWCINIIMIIIILIIIIDDAL